MFKVGFLLRCADEGLSEEETDVRIKAAGWLSEQYEKQADPISGVAGAAAKALKNLTWAGMASAGLLGGVGGYAAGSLSDNPTDPEDIKRQELISAYQQQTDRVRRQLARGHYRDTQLRKPSFSSM
jgi:hypothetical protein